MRSKLLLALIGATALAGAARADMIFLSNQLRPIEEAEKVRQVILKDFPEPVEYVVDEPGPWVARIKAEAQAGSVNTGLLGGLHGDFATVTDALDPLDDVMRTARRSRHRPELRRARRAGQRAPALRARGCRRPTSWSRTSRPCPICRPARTSIS